MEARFGGDLSVATKIRAYYLLTNYYKNGDWRDRIEVGYPLSPRVSLTVRCRLPATMASCVRDSHRGP